MADMEVNMKADMEVYMVADMKVYMVADMKPPCLETLGALNSFCL